jgi:hypothetical protein
VPGFPQHHRHLAGQRLVVLYEEDGGGVAGWSQGRKVFFFEKKKQKTFGHFGFGLAA